MSNDRHPDLPVRWPKSRHRSIESRHRQLARQLPEKRLSVSQWLLDPAPGGMKARDGSTEEYALRSLVEVEFGWVLDWVEQGPDAPAAPMDGECHGHLRARRHKRR